MIKIIDAKPDPLDLPKIKAVTIGQVATGKIEPHLRHDDRLSWHASIDPTQACQMSHTVWLIHGHGETPRMAVIDAIIRERALLAEKLRVLAAIESELGSTGMTPEQMRSLEGGVRERLTNAIQAAGGFAEAGPRHCGRAGALSTGVAETTLAVTGADPPLVITGPGGDFRVEHRGCEGCGDLFSALAHAHGRFCQRCLERRQVERMMGGAM